nr:MAG TPA: hypothetical protein [Bacteriophage sp.]
MRIPNSIFYIRMLCLCSRIKLYICRTISSYCSRRVIPNLGCFYSAIINSKLFR